MSNETTKSAAVITDAQESEILAIFRTLHGKVLNGLQEVGVEPTFNAEFHKCGAVDYKNMHQQARILVSDKLRARETARLAPIVQGIEAARNTYLAAYRAEKSEYDAMVSATPEKFRKHIAPFTSTYTVPAADVCKVFEETTCTPAVMKELNSDTLKTTFNYNLGADGSLTFRAPKPAPKADKSEDAAKAA
jgi:hypothetical protein